MRTKIRGYPQQGYRYALPMHLLLLGVLYINSAALLKVNYAFIIFIGFLLPLLLPKIGRQIFSPTTDEFTHYSSFIYYVNVFYRQAILLFFLICFMIVCVSFYPEPFHGALAEVLNFPKNFLFPFPLFIFLTVTLIFTHKAQKPLSFSYAFTSLPKTLERWSLMLEIGMRTAFLTTSAWAMMLCGVTLGNLIFQLFLPPVTAGYQFSRLLIFAAIAYCYRLASIKTEMLRRGQTAHPIFECTVFTGSIMIWLVFIVYGIVGIVSKLHPQGFILELNRPPLHNFSAPVALFIVSLIFWVACSRPFAANVMRISAKQSIYTVIAAQMPFPLLLWISYTYGHGNLWATHILAMAKHTAISAIAALIVMTGMLCYYRFYPHIEFDTFCGNTDDSETRKKPRLNSIARKYLNELLFTGLLLSGLDLPCFLFVVVYEMIILFSVGQIGLLKWILPAK